MGIIAEAVMQRLAVDAKIRLHRLLETWAGMNEADWSRSAVDRLRDEMLDLFSRDPREAGAWFKGWRAGHPEARLW